MTQNGPPPSPHRGAVRGPFLRHPDLKGNSDMGPILSRLFDLRDPRFGIDAMRPETLEFEVTVDALGTPTASATAGLVQTLAGYTLSVHTIEAWQAGGPVVGDRGPSLVSFVPYEAGRNQDMFKRSIKIAGFLGPQGASWHLPYRAIGGTDFNVKWSVDAAWVALVNAQQTFGVRLLCDYYRTPDPNAPDQLDANGQRIRPL